MHGELPAGLHFSLRYLLEGYAPCLQKHSQIGTVMQSAMSLRGDPALASLVPNSDRAINLLQ